MKPWQAQWPRGRMVDHPAVVAESKTGDPWLRPQLRRRDGLRIVTYSRTRVYLDRDAWEMLPSDGVLLMRVRSASAEPYALAFTPEELEAVFAPVRETRSWEQVRAYHFPTPPRAVQSFRVGSKQLD